MRVLVTGGAGFIGSHLVHALAKGGYDVVALDNLHRAYQQTIPPGTVVIEGDIRDREIVRRAMEG